MLAGIRAAMGGQSRRALVMGAEAQWKSKGKGLGLVSRAWLTTGNSNNNNGESTAGLRTKAGQKKRLLAEQKQMANSEEEKETLDQPWTECSSEKGENAEQPFFNAFEMKNPKKSTRLHSSFFDRQTAPKVPAGEDEDMNNADRSSRISLHGEDDGSELSNLTGDDRKGRFGDENGSIKYLGLEPGQMPPTSDRESQSKEDETEAMRHKKLYDKRAELFQTDNLEVVSATVESERAKQDRLIGYRVFRAMAPYIAVHYGSVVVIHVPGEVLESEDAEQVMHDIVLLKTLGIKPVLIAGCRPQIRRKLEQVGKKSLFVQGNRVCDTETLYHCQSVAGHVRLYIESLLTRGLMNSPTGVGSVTVTSGNFVRAIAFGVRGGIDFLHTGTVKKVNAKRIQQLLDQGDVVVLSHLGVSGSGQIYHCRSEDVAVQAGIDLQANKLVFLHNGEGVVDKRKLGGAIVHNLPLNVARRFSERLAEELGQSGQERVSHSEVDPKTQWKLQFLDYLQGAMRAVSGGVHRAHLVSRHIQGSIISELCTRDGIGLLISQDLYDGVRPAHVHDVPAIKSLIAPLEKANILITRPPKQIEKEINNFIVFEREGMILACCHLRRYPDPRYGNGAVEMSCVAVSVALHGEGIGNALLSYCLRSAYSEGIKTLFVLTTRTQGWFIDRGFKEVGPEHLPPDKLKTYDYSRNSKVFFKHIEDERAIDEEEILWFRQNRKK